jgi:hypothetical protein
MSRREDRERRIAGWLEHLQSWKASGEALSAYARSHGVEPWSMYYWRNVLRREGHWPREAGESDRGQKAAAASGSTRVPLRFASVRFEQASGSASVTVRVMLANGRRVEVELEDMQRLSEVLSALESAA